MEAEVLSPVDAAETLVGVLSFEHRWNFYHD